MGVAQSVTSTGTTMFLHQFLLYVCTAAPLTTSSPQSYFHNFGNQGTYTSVNHGSSSVVHHPPQQQQPYGTSSPTVKSFYNAPVAKPAAYHAPLPKPYVHHHQPRPSYHHPHSPPQPHGPGVEYDKEKCAVDYVEKEAEVCVPTFKTDCEREDVKNGLVIEQQEECYQVTKPVCTETEEIADSEVHSSSFTLIPVETEAKLVDVKWEKSCADDTICVNPHHAVGGYAAPTHCVEEYRHVCHL